MALYTSFIARMFFSHVYPLYSLRPFYLTARVGIIAILFLEELISRLSFQALKRTISALARSRRTINAMDEQFKDVKRHFTIVKESNSAKDAQMQLLQADV